MKKILLCLILVFLTFKNTKANFVDYGNVITYEYIGLKKYKIILTRYRQCSGAAFSDSQTMQLSTNGTCAAEVDFVTKRESIKNITLRCSSTVVCNPENTSGTGLSAFEAHTYSKIIDFDSNPFKTFITNTCCELYFSFKNTQRPSLINTFIASGLYNYSMLNICLGAKNSSIKVTNNPIFKTFCNNSFLYNPGMIDSNNDSIVFSLDVPHINSRTDSVIYNTPLHSKIPITPICVTPITTCLPGFISNIYTGFDHQKTNNDLILTPGSCNESTGLVIRANEFKKDSNGNYNLIGITRLDFTLIIESISNINLPPEIEKMECQFACIKDTFSYTIVAKDPTPSGGTSDTTFLTLNDGIPGSRFTINDPSAKDKTGVFKWKPTSADIKPNPYYVNFIVKESNCLSPMQASKSLCIYVVDSIKTGYTLTSKSNGTLIVNANTSGGSPLLPFSHFWQIADNAAFTNSKTLSKSTDSIRRLNPGKYYVSLFINNGSSCLIRKNDSVIIAPYFRFNFNNTERNICKRSTINIKPNLKDAQRPINYVWQVSGDTAILSNDSILNVQVANQTLFILSATDNNNQIYNDTLLINVKNAPNLSQVSNPSPRCVFDNQFNLLSAPPIGIAFDTTKFTTFEYSFRMKDIRRTAMLSSNAPYIYFTNFFYNSMLNQNYIPANKRDSFYFIQKDTQTGCADSALFSILVDQNPVVKLNDRTFCQNLDSINPASLIIQPISLASGNYSWQLDSWPNTISVFELPNILTNYTPTVGAKIYSFNLIDTTFSISNNVNIRRRGKYKLKFCFKETVTGCQTCAFSYATIIGPPSLDFNNSNKLCASDSLILLNNFVDKANGRWDILGFNGSNSDDSINPIIANMVDSINIIVKSKPGLYKWKYTNNSFLCQAIDSLTIKINGAPTIKILGAQDTIYDGETFTLTGTKNRFIQWDNGSISASRDIRNFALPQGSYNFTLTYTDTATGCANTATAKIYVSKAKRPLNISRISIPNVLAYPNPSSIEIIIESDYEITSVNIYDMNGKMIFKHAYNIGKKVELNINNLANGAYFLEIIGKNYNVFKSFQVLHD